jgi:hypothetical protein
VTDSTFVQNGAFTAPRARHIEEVPLPIPGRAQVALLTLLASLLAASPCSAAEPFKDLLKRWDSPAVEAQSRTADGFTVKSGRLTLRLMKGRVATVRAGDEVVGLFFSGNGRLEYLSDDAVEHPVVKYAAKKNSGLDATPAGAGLLLTEAFTGALWLASGSPLPALPESADAGSLAEEFAKHRDRFSNIHERPPAQLFARARRDVPATPYVRVEAGGGKDELVYVLDSIEAASESLSVASRWPWRVEAGDSRKFLTLLSDQPVGRDRRDLVRPMFLLTEVDLTLTASDGTHAKLSVGETFQPVGGSPGVLLLDLHDTLDRWNRLGQLETKKLNVSEILDEQGNRLEFDHRNTSLAVALRTPMAPGRPAKLRFELEGDLLHRPDGDNYWELGTEPWFPQPGLGSQYYTVHSTVKVKKPFTALVPGKTIRRVEEGEYNLLETRIDKPVQLFVVLAGKYKWEEETKDGLTIRVASYGGNNTRAQRNLLKLSRNMIEYYTGFLGPFPFEEFNVVEINDYGYGQAPPAFMFITTEAFNPIQGEVNQYFSGGINERFAHEIAHQWWGHVVKTASDEEEWLSESFAEYSAALLIRELRGKNDYKKMLLHWRRQAEGSREIAPIPFANRAFARNDMTSAYGHRIALLYSKGPVLLEALHRELGDRGFLVFLASVQSNLTWKFGTTRQVTRILDAVGKKDYGPFMEQYYWGLDLPAK